MDTTQNWRYPENVVPASDLNYWDGLSALKMYSQEDRKIPNYIHLENSRRNCPKCWNKIIHINKAGSSVPSPPNESGKIRAIREGGVQIRGPQLFNNLPVNICGQTG